MSASLGVMKRAPPGEFAMVVKPGQPVRLVSDPPFKYDVQKRVPDVTKSEKVLGFQCSTSLDKMLDEVVPWVKQQVELGNI